jgi:hypothetical protein
MAFSETQHHHKAKTSSMTSISGSRNATANQSHRHSRAIALYRRVYITAQPKSIISSSFDSISFGHSKYSSVQKMFSLPVISPLNPVPTSNNEAIRPLDFMLPVVGAVTFG